MSLSNYTFLFSVVAAENGAGEEEELGGLFRVSRPQNSKKVQANAFDCSRFHPDTSHNWDLEEVQLLVIYWCYMVWQQLKKSQVLNVRYETNKKNMLKWNLNTSFQMLNSIRDCFVTGKWEEGQDAATLLKEDGKRGDKNWSA